METVALGLLIFAGYLGDMFFSRYGENWGYAGILIGSADGSWKKGGEQSAEG